MARYTGADCKLCRREKMKLFLKGAKCDSPKCPIEIRPYPPGEHGRNRPKESEYLLQILERQQDNVVYRAGFAKSRDMARQLVRHGHFVVNGKKVDIPSYRVSENDIIDVKPGSMELIPDKMRILVHSLPARAQIDTQVQEQLIVEYYSK